MATEQRAYNVVRRTHDFEIRFYPPAHLASVEVGGGYGALRGEGFNELAGYIFGGNATRAKIAMTAPVIMDLQPDKPAGTMSFVMPTGFALESRPAPVSKRVFFQTTEPVYLAALTFGGFASSSDLEEQQARLFAALEQAGLQHEDRARYFFYDPPYKVLGRRNEVVVGLLNFDPAP